MSLRREKNYWQQAIEKKEYVPALLCGIALGVFFVYLFYRTYKAFFIGLIIFVYYMREWERECMEKKKAQFREQFKDAMQSIAVALKVGYSVENAIRETRKELEQTYGRETVVIKEFLYMEHKLDMNLTAEQTVSEFAEKVKQEDAEQFATVFAIAKRSGGNMIATLEKAIERICEKAETEKEIATLISAKRLEFRVMSMIPLGMIFYMNFSFPEFLAVLYGTTAGTAVMTICLLIYGGAYILGRRMIEIEV